MASQLEVRLRHRIQEEKDSSLQGILQAKLACYFARIGEFDQAESIRIELRQKFGDGKSAKISILLMLLDGLLLFYRDLSSGARDRIARANLISTTFHEHELTALTSAWLAHIDFNRCQFLLMTNEIRKCNELLTHDDGTATCRISLVLGDAFLYSGQREPSQFWYERARNAATVIGDQAAIGAITYNRAALNVQNLRLKCIANEIIDDDIKRAQAELQTAINYQVLARLKSLDHLLRAASVAIRIVKKEYELAVIEASSILDLKTAPIESGEYFILLTDLAKCHAIRGDLGAARKICEGISALAVSKLDEDDKVIIYDSLAGIFEIFGDEGLTLDYLKMMRDSMTQHSNGISELSVLISEFINP